MKTDKYYELLKASPLSMPYDKGTIEEVAIWFDMNCTKTSDVIKMLKAIERNYHNYETDTIIETRSSSSTVSSVFSVSSTFNKYGFNPNCPPSFTFLMLDYYFSNNMLYWLFKVITETDSLNNIVLNKKFFMFTINTRNKYKNKIKDEHKNKIKKGHLYSSPADFQLFEIFAELADIIENKSL